MANNKLRFSIKTKIYIFIVVTIVLVALVTSLLSYNISADQIDKFYKQMTADNARNFSTMVDGDFLAELRDVAVTDEYQALRATAEETEDEQIIEDYLREKGLWGDYNATRNRITKYLTNVEGIRYLYIFAYDGSNDYDGEMYLLDSDEEPIYETGLYEEREEELIGVNLAALPEPTISHGMWGWLCSDFKPVYTSDGKLVAVVGCDVEMDDVMRDRRSLLSWLIGETLIVTIAVLASAFVFVRTTIIRPLTSMTKEMKKFNPSHHASYEDAGVMKLDIRTSDEISEIYEGIRGMQRNIIDYLKDLLVLQEDKLKAEDEIGKLSQETYKDALTGVGNKAAYIKKTDDLNDKLEKGFAEFAIVMVDMNNLKYINDDYGHRAGDQYIRGCCRQICDIFKHSPVFRVGGDEFVAILQGADYDDRNMLCSKLRARFRETYLDDNEEPWLRFSSAVGLAESQPTDSAVEYVFKRADEAMYKDKAAFKEEFGGYR